MYAPSSYSEILMRKYLIAAIYLSLQAVFPVAAQDTNPSQESSLLKAVLADDSRIWIEGSSTIGNFSSYASVTELESAITDTQPESNPAGSDTNTDRYRISKMILKIPIEKMKSRFIGLASHLHRALKYREFPYIVVEMQSYSIKQIIREDSGENEPDSFSITAQGFMSLGGVTNPAVLKAEAVLRDGCLEIKGHHDVLMSDFGITPPSLFFGAIVVNDHISVNWDIQSYLEPYLKDED